MNNIDGLDNYYISPSGFVKNKTTGKALKNSKNVQGYAVVNLPYKGAYRKFLVHRLVAIEYLPNPENKPEVAHIDGNKMNASIFNLRWSTRIENEKDKLIHGTLRTPPPYGKCKLSREQVLKLRKDRKLGHSLKELSNKYSLAKSAVYNIISGKTYNHV